MFFICSFIKLPHFIWLSNLYQQHQNSHIIHQNGFLSKHINHKGIKGSLARYK